MAFLISVIFLARRGARIKIPFLFFTFQAGEKARVVVYLDSRKRNSQRGNENGATNRRGYKLEQRSVEFNSDTFDIYCILQN